MPIDPNAVGLTGGPVRRSWTSKDALLYALGVGAGCDELAFTTENTKDTPQRVLPTMAVVLGGGGVPFDKLGTFNAAMLADPELDRLIEEAAHQPQYAIRLELLQQALQRLEDHRVYLPLYEPSNLALAREGMVLESWSCSISRPQDVRLRH